MSLQMARRHLPLRGSVDPPASAVRGDGHQSGHGGKDESRRFGDNGRAACHRSPMAGDQVDVEDVDDAIAVDVAFRAGGSPVCGDGVDVEDIDDAVRVGVAHDSRNARTVHDSKLIVESEGRVNHDERIEIRVRTVVELGPDFPGHGYSLA